MGFGNLGFGNLVLIRSFYRYWWNYWSLLFKLSFHYRCRRTDIIFTKLHNFAISEWKIKKIAIKNQKIVSLNFPLLSSFCGIKTKCRIWEYITYINKQITWICYSKFQTNKNKNYQCFILPDQDDITNFIEEVINIII
jgi:hypothetical protein